MKNVGRFIPAGIAALVLGACVPEENPDPGPPPDRNWSEEAAQACRDAGGQPTRGFAGPTCAMPTPDGGKSCTSSADCTGFCLAETRTCSPETPYFGCHELYDNGQTSVICVD